MNSRPPGAKQTDPAHEDVIRAIEPEVERNLRTLPAVESAWQPTDYLPDLSGEQWHEQVASLREAALAIPDALGHG